MLLCPLGSSFSYSKIKSPNIAIFDKKVLTIKKLSNPLASTSLNYLDFYALQMLCSQKKRTVSFFKYTLFIILSLSFTLQKINTHVSYYIQLDTFELSIPFTS